MILQDLIIPSRVNLQCEFSGLDSLDRCLNKEHFQSYPYKVEYVYNSRGFRDAEWPESLEELKNAIWCVGDSFTVGIGSPYHFTWPQVLSAATGRRCINISMDGASNTWISRRAQQIVREVAPAHMVVMWSYLHRREHPDTKLSDDRRIVHYEESILEIDDLKNFVCCYQQLNAAAISTDIFNSIIPYSGLIRLVDNQVIANDWNNLRDPIWPDVYPKNKTEFAALSEYIQQELFSQPDVKDSFEQMFACDELSKCQLLELTNLDYARDYHHFDCITSKFFVEKVCETLFPNGNTS